MVALPQIDQATKPAGTPGQSRDDLDLFTVPGTEIVLTDTGGTATTWLWQILDQPPGATATLSTPAAATTNLTGANVRGSYFIQLVVDGGALPTDVYRIIAAVQIDTPSWVTPPLNRPLRIPAKGETIEFNVESFPDPPAPNTRGWAQEMDHWFRAIADFGFGVRAQDGGAPVGTEAFYTLNFVGFTVADAGGGVLNVTAAASTIAIQDEGIAVGTRPIINFIGAGVTAADNPGQNRVDVTIPGGGGGGVEVRNGSAAVIAGGPWSQLRYRAALTTANMWTYFNADTNVHVQPGTGEAEVVVTAWHHQEKFHSGGILLPYDPPNKDAWAGSILTGPNPMTLSFAALSTSGATTKASTFGACIDTVMAPIALPFSLAPTTGKELYLIYVRITAGGIAAGAQSLAEAQATVIPLVVTNLHRDFPTSTVSLTIAGNNITLDGGPITTYVAGKIVRVYDPTGYYWLEVYCNGAPSDGTELWDIHAAELRRKEPCKLMIAPYWLDGAVSTWGVDILGTQTFIDARQFGSVSSYDLQDDALKRIDALGGDLQLQAGVVFTHGDTQFDTGNETIDSFGLVPNGVGGPTTQMLAIRGGVVWASGRRYVVDQDTTIASFGYSNVPICIAAQVTGQGTASVVAFTVATGNPIDAVERCLRDTENVPFDASEAITKYVPLWFGFVDAGGTVLEDDGRVDLRRDVAHHNTWTVASRDDVTEFYLGLSYQTRVGLMENPRRVAGKTVAEFGQIAGALAWHGALTGSDNLTPLPNSAEASYNNPVTVINVIGDTLETFPIHLRNNVTIQGAGSPFVFVTPTQWWVNYGVPTYTWTYLNVGDDSGLVQNRFVYDVTLKDFSVVLTRYTSAIHGTTGAINVWGVDYDPAVNPPGPNWVELGTTQNVLIENIGFDLVDVSALTTATYLSAVKVQDTIGPNAGGFFNGVTIRNCKTPVFAARIVVDPDKRAFNEGVHIRLSNPIYSSNLKIEGCEFSVNVHGVYSDGVSSLFTNLTVAENRIDTRLSMTVGPDEVTYGVYLNTNGDLNGCVIRDNDIALVSPIAGTISQGVNIGCPNNDVVIRDNKVIAPGTDVLAIGIAILNTTGPTVRARVHHNSVQAWNAGIVLAGSVQLTDVEITENFVQCTNIASTSGAGIGIGTGVSVSNLIKVARNVSQSFPQAFTLTLDRVNDLVVEGNQAYGNTQATSFGLEMTIGGTSASIRVSENVMQQFRRGVIASLPENISAVSISRNMLWCQYDEVESGLYNSRGIHVVFDPTADMIAGLQVNDNVIRNTLAMSAIDVLPGGSIVVENQSAFMVDEVQINGNDLMLHDETTNLTPVDFTDFSGVLVTGPVRGLQVNSNKIVNRAARLLSGNEHGGIVVLHSTLFIPLRDHMVQINNNLITWCDASFLDGVETAAAGIYIDTEFPYNIQVCGNEVNVQSLISISVGLAGALHGILIGRTFGANVHVQVHDNKISAEKYDVGAELHGVCGTAIWLFGGVADVSVHNNNCQGFFRKCDIGSIRHEWGIISVLIGYDVNESVLQDVSIDGNTLVNLPGDLIAQGPQNIAYGIRVGNDNRALPANSWFNLMIRNNHIVVDLDATGSPPTSAAIAVLGLSNTSTSIADYAFVSGNFVERNGLNGTTVHGIVSWGWKESQWSDNFVKWAALGNELFSPAYVGAVATDIWTNNRAGDSTNNGTIALGVTYIPQPAPNNWNGLVFS